MRLSRYVLDTLDRHYLKRRDIAQLAVIQRARDFYARLGYANGMYLTFNMQYWCRDDMDDRFWVAVRAELKVIHSYRPDNS